MKPRGQAVVDLNEAGYWFLRHGKKHDIFCNPELKKQIPLKRHDFDESDLRYIRKEIKDNLRDSEGKRG